MTLQESTYLSLWRGVLPYRPSMRDISAEVAERWGVTVEDMRDPDNLVRRGLDTRPRDEAIAAIRATGRFSWTQIGRFFRRDHSTCISAVKRHLERLASVTD